MGELLAEVWHNSASRFLEWRPGQRLRLVHTVGVHATGHMAALDEVYAICNVDDSAHARALGLPDPDRADRYRALAARSLSRGDVVVLVDLDDQRRQRHGYACAAGGAWARLDDDQVPSPRVVLDEHVLRFTVPAALDDDTAERLRQQVTVTLIAQVGRLRAELAAQHPDLDVGLAD